MPFAFNGFGTAFCGQCDFRPDGSFVTTEWITAAYVPLIPLRSLRLARTREQDVNLVVYRSESYSILDRLPVLWPQVLRVYAFMACAVVWWIFLVWLFFFRLALMSGDNVPVIMLLMLLFVCLLGLPLIGVVWRLRASAARCDFRAPNARYY